MDRVGKRVWLPIMYILLAVCSLIGSIIGFYVTIFSGGDTTQTQFLQSGFLIGGFILFFIFVLCIGSSLVRWVWILLRVIYAIIALGSLIGFLGGFFSIFVTPGEGTPWLLDWTLTIEGVVLFFFCASRIFRIGGKMPVQEFALDATESQHIKVYTGGANDPVTILLNGDVLGNLLPQECAHGKDFQLPDGSTLHVQIVAGQLQVSKNGDMIFPLSSESKFASEYIRPQRGGCLTAWLLLNLFSTSAYTLLFFVAGLGGSPYTRMNPDANGIFLLMGLIGILAIVGVAALLSWRKWGLVLVAITQIMLIGMSVMARPVVTATFGPIPGAPTFGPLIGVAITYFWLRANGVWGAMK